MLLAAGAPSLAFVSIWDAYGTSSQFTSGVDPVMAAAWAEFVRKINQNDAGPAVRMPATVIVANNQTTNLLAALDALVTPGRTGDSEAISNVSVLAGAVALGSGGAVLYTAGAAGTDTISYTVTDQLGDSITAVTTLTIDPGPSINAATLKLAHGVTYSLATLSASLVTPGLKGDTETYSNVTAAYGTVTVGPGGVITYTPPPSGTDTLSYTVTDQAGDTVTGSTTIAVDPGPILTPGGTTATPGQIKSLAYYIKLLIAPGLAGDTETITAISAATGSVTLASNGTITDTAPASGRDTLTYTVQDQLGDTATGTYTVTVNPAMIQGKALHFGGPTDPAYGAGDPGVPVTLLTSAGAVVATNTTGASGYYSFGALLAGTYEVEYTPPLGQGVKPGTSAVTAPFSVATGAVVTAGQGSFITLASLGGQVVFAGAGQAGVVLALLDTSGNLLASTTTDSNGNFIFYDLAAGSYQVQVAAPAGELIAPGGSFDPTTGLSGTLALATGQAGSLPAAVLVAAPATIFGTVAYAGAGEAGVTVSLLAADGTMAATTTSDTSGNFAFAGLAGGSYQVAYFPPAGELLGSGGPADPATGLTQMLTVAAGQSLDLPTETLVSAAGGVFGSVTLAGVGQSGLTVTLLDTSGNVLATAATDAFGNFLFSGLNPGAYQLQYTAPKGAVLQTGGPANSATGLTPPITVIPGQTLSLAPEQLLTSPANIQSLVLHLGGATDKPWGGGDAGVTVSLLDAAGNLLATTLTHANGWYIFRQLGAGVYQISVTPPAGQEVKPGQSGVISVTVGAGATVGAPVIDMVSAFTMTGSGVTDVVGDGSYIVTGNASNSSLTLGNGNQQVSLTGGGDTVVTGRGNQTISLAGTGNAVTVGTGTSTISAGSGNAVVHAAGGNVTITAGGGGNLFDAGSGLGFLNADGSAGNNFMLNPGGAAALTRITGFNAAGDTLDLARTLAGTGILPNLSNLGSYVTAASSGANTVLSVDPTGGSGTPQAFAVLLGVQTTMAALQAAHDFVLT